MVRSKRIAEALETKSLPPNTGYCRKCQTVKLEQQFFKAVDNVLDSSGLMSVCKDCINELYLNILDSEHGSIEKTVFRLCRMLNVKYQEEAIQLALEHITIKQSDPNKFFGFYRLKLLLINRADVNDTLVDLTYVDNPVINTNNNASLEFEVDDEVISFWGKGYETEDYRWMEQTLDEWKKTHKCDSKAEEILFKEIVFKQLEIEKARQEKKSTASLVKELQEIMKTAAVDPAKANVASAGKSQDTFSAFIKLIEESEPAEVFGAERDAFKDFQGIDKYFQKYVTRPLKNFILGSRDFNIDSDADDNELEEFEEVEPLNYQPEEEQVETSEEVKEDVS